MKAINDLKQRWAIQRSQRMMDRAFLQMQPYMAKMDDEPVQIALLLVSGIALGVSAGKVAQSELDDACARASEMSGIPSDVLRSHGDATLAMMAAYIADTAN